MPEDPSNIPTPSRVRRADALAPTCFLRLDPIGQGERIDVPLSRDDGMLAQNPVLDLCEGSVLQASRYRFALIVPAEAAVSFASAVLTVNGESVPCVRAGSGHSTLLKDDAVMHGYELDAADARMRPFGLVCGYARMQLDLLDARGQVVESFLSKDVLCQQDTPIAMDNVNAMIEALLGDPAHDVALAWMMSDGEDSTAGAYSLMEGGFVEGASRSVPTYLAVIEAGLDAAEAALPFLRGHAASRIQREERIIDASRVRRMGTSEARWIVSHPEALRPASSGQAGISHGGRSYAPARVSTEKAVRSFDVYENRLCMSFLANAGADLADFEAKLQRDANAVNPLRMAGSAVDSGRILMVALARAFSSRQRAHMAKAAALRERALRLLRLYRRVLPGVRVAPLGEMRLVRTKTFKEIRAYSQMYAHIERFVSFGESIFEANGLAIAALRLDRAYEMYALYRMLHWLASNGFAPVEGERAVYAGRYGYTSRVFDDAPHIANVYHLQRGDVRVSVHYEPVVFADGREAHGMTLHRLRAGRQDAFTPDYVVTVRREDAAQGPRKQTFVLDAKYRSRKGLLHHYADERGQQLPSAFEACAGRYLLNMADAETGRIPEAMWLLGGLDDEDDQLMALPALPWDAVHAPAYPSGVALVTPRHGIDALFEAMGLGGPQLSAGTEAAEG